MCGVHIATVEARPAMEQRDNVWRSSDTDAGLVPACDCEALQIRLRHAETQIRRLTRCVQLKDEKLRELGKVLANSATAHYCVEERLQRELDALRIDMPAEVLSERHGPIHGASRGGGVIVRLPYLTTILSVLFDAMHVFWGDCDDGRLPKSSTVAHAIDERLGLRAQASGEGSRTGQAYASAIRPDWVKDADNRHHRPRPTS
ncbi:TPA: hypothetical protein QDA71_002182 [Burkholderia vietnamiensis]|nr:MULTISPECIES: hypothetical protein [Burkholderia cepacia complex]MBR8165088.1 hypothetical protein [Burkholderia vietnamiensis]MCA8146308.1 hypothetical protein [Burkholderia vietnamiensis]MDN8069759.1 hypothetical protein [Burkholderia vietnamiensis]HDR8945195.1 hypothetical protein [Burkholderia vietnamiensis]HDR9210274.1 hypothetical protein [Burkholderia vietnamiensis]